MAHIIGLDFGNANSFTVFVSGINEITRKGGNVKWLVPATQQMGVPSMFHIDSRGRKTYGSGAANGRPRKNRRDMLKSKIGQTERIGDFTISYDDEIAHLIKHLVDGANDILEQQTGETTDTISIAYPVTYDDGQANRLVELAQRVTLKNGKKLRVLGRIKEPEAAALSYLSEADLGTGEKDFTVMVYDLGAGTFDASVVTAHQRRDGTISNYEVLDNDGVQCGGKDFTNAMIRILEDVHRAYQVPLPQNDSGRDRLMNEAEDIKIYLSTNDYRDYVVDEEEDVAAEITVQQFERATEALVNRTVEITKALYDRVAVKPTKIVLAGGQSQMPLIRRRLAEAFPNIGEQNIIFHKPQQAIAEGAARFGVLQRDTVVIPRTGKMIGLGYVRVDSNDRSKGTQVSPLIPRNTPIPLERPAEHLFSTAKPAKNYRVTFYQAKVNDPELKENENKEFSDFSKIVSLDIDFQTNEPGLFDFIVAVNIDALGNMVFSVRDPNNHFRPVISEQINMPRG